MANQMKHSGEKPELIFVVSDLDTKVYWVYVKEGHAINRLLSERKSGKSVEITRYCAGIPSQQRPVGVAHDS